MLKKLQKLKDWLLSEGTLNFLWLKPYIDCRGFSLVKWILTISLGLYILWSIPLAIDWIPNLFSDIYNDKTEKKSEVIRNIGLVTAALISLPFLIWRSSVAHKQAIAATRQAETAVKSHISDTFTKAISQLGSIENNEPNIEVRLGGIYTLEKIAITNEDYYSQIIEILCSYVRNNCPLTEIIDNKPETENNKPPSIDIQTIITILGRINKNSLVFNLQCTNLRQVDLSKVNFQRTNLVGADLTGANLTLANLTSANLIGVNLTAVNLSFANLNKAELTAANLTAANLTAANLTGANLSIADLEHANLKYANLRYANLYNANLQNTILKNAILYFANLEKVDLEGANLKGAKLENANLEGVLNLDNKWKL